MEDVADMLGFKSKNAKDFIINWRSPFVLANHKHYLRSLFKGAYL